MMIDAKWLLFTVEAGALLLIVSNHLGWVRGWRKRGELADEFFESARPLLLDTGWLKAKNGEPMPSTIKEGDA